MLDETQKGNILKCFSEFCKVFAKSGRRDFTYHLSPLTYYLFRI